MPTGLGVAAAQARLRKEKRLRIVGLLALHALPFTSCAFLPRQGGGAGQPQQQDGCKGSVGRRHDGSRVQLQCLWRELAKTQCVEPISVLCGPRTSRQHGAAVAGAAARPAPICTLGIPRISSV